MKHIAKILIEFTKYALNNPSWNNHSTDYQVNYIHDHPNTKKTVTHHNNEKVPHAAFIELAKKKYSNIKESAQEVLKSLKSIAKDTNSSDMRIFLKNVNDLSYSMNLDVNVFSNKFRDFLQSKANEIKQQSRQEFLERNDRQLLEIGTSRAAILDDGYEKFSYIRRYVQPKINLNNALISENGNLSLQEAIVRNKDGLQKALTQWKTATNDIANTSDYMRLFGLVPEKTASDKFAAVPQWWTRLTSSEQKAYLRTHPHSDLRLTYREKEVNGIRVKKVDPRSLHESNFIGYLKNVKVNDIRKVLGNPNKRTEKHGIEWTAVVGHSLVSIYGGENDTWNIGGFSNGEYTFENLQKVFPFATVSKTLEN